MSGPRCAVWGAAWQAAWRAAGTHTVSGIAAVAALTLFAVEAGGQRTVVPFISASVVDSRVRLGAEEIERASGSVWGIGARTAVSDLFVVSGRIAGGTLAGRSPGAEDRGYSEAVVAVLLTPDAWLTVSADLSTRVLEGSLIRQRWNELRLAAEAGTGLLDRSLRGTVRASVAPLVSVSGQSAPDLSVGLGTGLDYSSGRLSGALAFELLRYDFPNGLAGRRLEQRTALTATVGWRMR